MHFYYYSVPHLHNKAEMDAAIRAISQELVRCEYLLKRKPQDIAI